MDIKTKEMYSEVYSILNLLGEPFIKKIPKNIYKIIQDTRSLTYTPIYDENISLNKQQIKRETLSMIALLHLNYWCDTEEEKANLNQMLKQNDYKYQNKLKEKYNPDDMFKKQKKKEIVENEDTVAMVEYKKSKFKKIIEKIKDFLKF